MKTRNKKILAVLLIICLAVAMVGCGMQGDLEADPDSTTGHIVGAILNFFQSITAKIGLPNYCVAIFILTLLVKLATHPLIVKQQKSTKNMAKLQGKIQDINRRYANNPEKRQEATMKMYREENINPMSSCLPLLIQMPIIMVLFWGMRNFIPPTGMEQYYSFFWIDNLSAIVSTTPYPYVLPVLCALTTLLQQFVSMANLQDKTQRMMLIIMPVMFLFICMQFPAGLCLYWMFYGIIGAVQTLIVNFQLKIGIFTPAEEKERKKQEQAAAKEYAKNGNQKNQDREVKRQTHTHTHQEEGEKKKLPDKPWQ